MGRRLRFIPKEGLVEVTARTIQGRFLLMPGPGWKETFVGVLARAQELYPVDIHAYVCLSNHFHLLVTPSDARQLALFMGHVMTNLSKEAGRRSGWRGPLFERRYQAIAVTEEEAAQVKRLRYVLAHGCKEGLVDRVGDWPGPHCAAALKTGTPAKGVWISRTRIWEARNHGRQPDPKEYTRQYLLHLTALPCWAHLPDETLRRTIGELIDSVEEEAVELRFREDGAAALGIETILVQNPRGRPKDLDRRPAPIVHAVSRRKQREFRELYREFVRAFYEAAERMRAGLPEFSFPEGAFSPSRAVSSGPG